MTTNRAIKIINKQIKCIEIKCEGHCHQCNFAVPTKEIINALEMAVSALKQKQKDEEFDNTLAENALKINTLDDLFENIKKWEKEAEQDMISRENARLCLTGEIKEDMTIEEYIKIVDERLKALTPVIPVVPKGRWNLYGRALKCSECGQLYDEMTRFCPNCGADMNEDWRTRNDRRRDK